MIFFIYLNFNIFGGVYMFSWFQFAHNSPSHTPQLTHSPSHTHTHTLNSLDWILDPGSWESVLLQNKNTTIANKRVVNLHSFIHAPFSFIHSFYLLFILSPFHHIFINSWLVPGIYRYFSYLNSILFVLVFPSSLWLIIHLIHPLALFFVLVYFPSYL